MSEGLCRQKKAAPSVGSAKPSVVISNVVRAKRCCNLDASIVEKITTCRTVKVLSLGVSKEIGARDISTYLDRPSDLFFSSMTAGSIS